MKEKYKVEIERLSDAKNNKDNVEEAWSKFKECLIKVADTVCGKENTQINKGGLLKRYWTKWKKEECGKERKKKYRSLSKTRKKMCRKAKNDYYNEIFNEIESLDKTHNPKLYQTVKQLRLRKLRSAEGVKNKDGKVLFDEKDIVKV